MRYAMIICGDDSTWADIPADQMQDLVANVGAWFEKWTAAGKTAPGGAELQPSSTAKTVRGGADGPVVTDGPFAELKEVVGGFAILDVEDMDEAVAIASTWPTLGSDPTARLELRPLIQH